MNPIETLFRSAPKAHSDRWLELVTSKNWLSYDRLQTREMNNIINQLERWSEFACNYERNGNEYTFS